MKNNFSPLWKIKQLTTNIGIYQHGKLNLPDPRMGYALEDQARALIVAHEFKDKNLEEIYLNYIIRSKRPDGLLHHYYYEDSRRFPDEGFPAVAASTQEAYGITLWSLLVTGNFKKNPLKEIVEKLKDNAYFWTSPRAMAAALLGLVSLPNQDSLEKELTEKLHHLFESTAQEKWNWFENYLVYANAILPWAMWAVGNKRKDAKSLEIAKKTTLFLIENCQIDAIPAPIGNNGWFKKGGEKPVYDQQPIDAAYLVCCLEKAYLATKYQFYSDWAKKWWNWFLGGNIQKKSLIDENLACCDALTPWGVNLNQGAESNICFLLAYLASKRLGFRKTL